MKSQKLITLVLILLLCYSFRFNQQDKKQNEWEEGKTAHDPYLIIYATRDVAQKISYKYIQSFAKEYYLIPDLIAMIEFENTNNMLNELILERENPIADVVIGLDQFSLKVLQEKEILIPYQSPELENISSELTEYLDPSYYLQPFAYSLSGFRLNSEKDKEITPLEEEKFTLANIAKSLLTSKLIIENPTTSSLGIEFLLQTIATYGDPYLNFTGFLNSDWREWWISNKDQLEIFTDDNNALIEWNNPNSNRSLIFSYNSDYGNYENEKNDTNSNFFFFLDKNQTNSWLHVEGVGLINDDPVPSLGKVFIDWILSTKFQNNISEELGMYPANKNALVSAEFTKNHNNLSEITLLNDLIETNFLLSNLDFWKEEWLELFSDEFDLAVIPGFHLKNFILCLIGGVYISLEYQKKRGNPNV